MKDFLIIGQGVAGSFLAWELLKRNQQIVIVDDNHRQSSSMISAGIINPVTGKRFALTDNFDHYFAHALNTYRQLESKFDQQFFEAQDICRIFQDEGERDHWMRKVRLNEGQQYSKHMNASKAISSSVNDPLGSVVIKKSGFCHAPRLLTVLKEYFQKQNLLAAQRFSYDDLTIDEKHVRYGGELFRAVIFCEGYQAQWNPFFDSLPFNSVKGEVLKVEIAGAPLPAMIINKGKWCAPLGQKQWIAGSTYIWNHLDCTPTEEARNQIVSGLQNCFENEIHVLDQKAGVRPVMKDQRVVCGRHNQYNNLAIFNGLGSKGFLTAAYYADHFANYLVGKSLLRADIAVNRFTKSEVQAVQI